MRITIDINGYYDWVPCPPGTEITEQDISSLRVKKMVDEKWAMKVTVPSPSDDQQHTMGLYEETIVQQLAAREASGREISREECVADLIRRSVHHHLHPSHLVKIHVVDDGPNEDLFKAALTAVGVKDQADAIERYMEEVDLEDYLNRFFKTVSFKQASKKSAKKTEKTEPEEA